MRGIRGACQGAPRPGEHPTAGVCASGVRAPRRRDGSVPHAAWHTAWHRRVVVRPCFPSGIMPHGFYRCDLRIPCVRRIDCKTEAPGKLPPPPAAPVAPSVCPTPRASARRPAPPRGSACRRSTTPSPSPAPSSCSITPSLRPGGGREDSWASSPVRDPGLILNLSVQVVWGQVGGGAADQRHSQPQSEEYNQTPPPPAVWRPFPHSLPPAVVAAIFVLIPFTFLPANCVAFVVKEREVRATHLQRLSGLRPARAPGPPNTPPPGAHPRGPTGARPRPVLGWLLHLRQPRPGGGLAGHSCLLPVRSARVHKTCAAFSILLLKTTISHCRCLVGALHSDT